MLVYLSHSIGIDHLFNILYNKNKRNPKTEAVWEVMIMNGKWQKLFNIVTLILLVVCVVKIGAVENELSNLRNSMNSNHNTLQSNISAISSNVRNEMEQANNLLSESSWNTADLNIEDKTATLSCSVVPKVYNPAKTTAVIICNGEKVPMTLENGRYTAELTIPIFENTIVSNVQFSEEGNIRTQQLNWSINPRYDMIPAAYIHYSGESGHNYKGNNITRYYRGHAEIDFEHRGVMRTIENAEIVTLINGKEVERSQFDLEELRADEYLSHYRAEFEQSYEVQTGDTIEMYMTFTDNNGWEYRGVLEDVTIGEKGEIIENREHYNAEADIYDADGNLLFAVEKP